MSEFYGAGGDNDDGGEPIITQEASHAAIAADQIIFYFSAAETIYRQTTDILPSAIEPCHAVPYLGGPTDLFDNLCWLLQLSDCWLLFACRLSPYAIQSGGHYIQV